VHVGAQFDRYPSYVQRLQQSAWASYLPDMITFRRADTLPLALPELDGVRFRAVSVGGSFYLAIDGARFDAFFCALSFSFSQFPCCIFIRLGCILGNINPFL
jgi:hypothetical protein